MLSPDFIAQMKYELTEQKQKLNVDLSELKPHTELGDDMDQNAIEVELDEVNQDIIAMKESDLEKIDNALLKIDAGTYGVDVEGNEIDEDRLRAMPWADKAI